MALGQGLFSGIKSMVTGKRPPIVPVVPLRGVIGQMGPFKRGLSIESVAEPLNRAFKAKHISAVALALNSPGGSPVQSSLIAQRIRQLAEENEVQVLAFCEDVAASGGYWLACAADEIIVDKSSIIGSIGVISSGFGFTEAIKKLGVQRRLHTAGENKSFLDPFLPERKADVERLKQVQGDMHDTFRAHVAGRRGDKLADDPDIFSGAFWTGERAVELGLADDTGEMRQMLRERFGENVVMPVVKQPKSWLSRKLGGSETGSPDTQIWADGLIAAVEEKLIWDRYRL